MVCCSLLVNTRAHIGLLQFVGQHQNTHWCVAACRSTLEHTLVCCSLLVNTRAHIGVLQLVGQHQSIHWCVAACSQHQSKHWCVAACWSTLEHTLGYCSLLVNTWEKVNMTLIPAPGKAKCTQAKGYHPINLLFFT